MNFQIGDTVRAGRRAGTITDIGTVLIQFKTNDGCLRVACPWELVKIATVDGVVVGAVGASGGSVDHVRITYVAVDHDQTQVMMHNALLGLHPRVQKFVLMGKSNW